MTFAETVEKIRQLAIQSGGEPAVSPLLDSGVISELLLPRVVDYVTMDIVKSPYQLQALRQQHSLSFSAGLATLPVTIKEEYADSWAWVSKPNTSYKREWFDYSALTPIMFPFCTVRGGNVYFRDPGEDVVTHSGMENLTAVTFPSLPSSASGTVDIKANILEQIITMCAAIVKGEIPLAAIGLDNSQIKPNTE